MISIFKNLLRLNLWPNIRCILENAPYALENNVYAVVVWSVLYMSVRSSWLIVLSSLFPYFSLVVLPVTVSGILKSSTISPFNSISCKCMLQTLGKLRKKKRKKEKKRNERA